MKKTAQFSMIKIPLIFAFGVVALLMFSASQCREPKVDDYYPPEPYSPSFTANGERYTSGGYPYLYFELKCTSDAVEITTIMVVGPHFTVTFSGGGEIYDQNQSIYLYDEERFHYAEGKYDFTIKGILRSGSHTGSSFTKTTGYELIIP